MLSHNQVDYIEAVGVEKILVDRRAVGVVLEDGNVIRARKFVASNVNPVETLSSWSAGRTSIRGSPTWRPASVLQDDPDLRGEPRPERAAAVPSPRRSIPRSAGSFMHIVGLESYAELQHLFEDCRSGQLPRKPFMNGATPSFHDPTQAPPGKHTAFMWQLAPYSLWGNAETGTRPATSGSRGSSRSGGSTRRI